MLIDFSCKNSSQYIRQIKFLKYLRKYNFCTLYSIMLISVKLGNTKDFFINAKELFFLINYVIKYIKY